MLSSKSISLFLLLFIGFIDIAGVGLVYPMFSSMVYQPESTLIPEGASEFYRGTCLGLLLAMMPMTQFFSAPILGMLSDQMGRKKVLLPSLIVGVMGYLIAMFAAHIGSFFLLLLSRLAIGVSSGSVSVVSACIADVSSQDEKAKNFGLFNMACGLGFTVGPFLGGILSTHSLGFLSGYSVPFFAAGAVSLLNLIFVYLLFKDSYSPQSSEVVRWGMGINNIYKAFYSKSLRMFFVSIFFACVGWSFYWEFIPVTWIKQYGFSQATIGNFYAYGAGFYAIACGFLIRPVVNRFSNEHIVCYAVGSCGVLVGALLFHSDMTWLLLYIPLQQCAVALFWPTAAAFVSNSVSEDVQGEVLGIFHSVESLAFAITPLMAGPLLGFSESMPLFVGAFAMLFAAGLLWSSLQRPKVVTDLD